MTNKITGLRKMNFAIIRRLGHINNATAITNLPVAAHKAHNRQTEVMIAIMPHFPRIYSLISAFRIYFLRNVFAFLLIEF